MEMNYQRELPISREDAWSILHDVELLRILLPGCEKLSTTGENSFNMLVSASIGPIKAKFNAQLRVVDLNQPVSYSMHIDANAGVLGHGRGEIKIRLEAVESGRTLINGDVTATVGGKMAQLGSRLVNVAAAGIANQFFTNLQMHLQAETVVISVVDETVESGFIHPKIKDARPPGRMQNLWVALVLRIQRIFT